MIRVHLACFHRVEFSCSEKIPRQNAWCPRCHRDTDVTTVEDRYITKCSEPGCRYVRYFPLGAEMAASVAAAKHMAFQRHSVYHWRSDRPEGLKGHVPADDPMEIEIDRLEKKLGARVVKDIPY